MLSIRSHPRHKNNSLRGRRLKGKGKGALGKGVLGARETRGTREEGERVPLPSPPSRAPRVSLAPKTPFPKAPFPFPFNRLPRRLRKVQRSSTPDRVDKNNSFPTLKECNSVSSPDFSSAKANTENQHSVKTNT